MRSSRWFDGYWCCIIDRTDHYFGLALRTDWYKKCRPKAVGITWHNSIDTFIVTVSNEPILAMYTYLSHEHESKTLTKRHKVIMDNFTTVLQISQTVESNNRLHRTVCPSGIHIDFSTYFCSNSWATRVVQTLLITIILGAETLILSYATYCTVNVELNSFIITPLTPLKLKL